MKEFLKSFNIDKNQLFTFNSLKEELQKEDKNLIFLSSGAKNINNILGKGFRSKTMYLIFGSNKTGKTQICHQLCVQAYKRSLNLIYFDTENTFRPERIKQFVDNLELDFNDVLKTILVSKIMSNNALVLKLKNLEKTIKKSQIKVILIDSINNYYRLEQGDKNVSFEKVRSNFLKILDKLNSLTREYNLITIATAQISPNFNKNAFPQEKPVGNQFLNHFFSEYLYLSYKEKDFGYIHLTNSTHLPEKKLLYRLTDKGIEDYKI
ncbi:MAG: ATPase domain-containing protein [Candidatus Lokiarchaeota archaeon]|jgi:DNA repair protein RadA